MSPNCRRNGDNRQQFDAGADHPRDNDIVDAQKIEGRDLLAQDLGVGHDQPFPAQVARGRLGVDLGFAADDQLDLFQVLRRADTQQHVAASHLEVALGDLDLAGAVDARHHDLGSRQADHVTNGQAVDIGVADLEVHGLDTGGVLGVLGLERGHLAIDADAQDRSHQNHGDQDAGDAEGIGDGVAEARHLQRRGVGADLFEHFLPGAEGRRVGDGTREQAERYRQRNVGDQEDGHRDQHPEDHDAGGQQVEGEAAPLERREEAGTDLDADGIDEKNQPEFADEIHDLGFGDQAEMPEKEPGEQDAADADFETADAQAADRQPEGSDQTQHKNSKGDTVQTGNEREDIVHGSLRSGSVVFVRRHPEPRAIAMIVCSGK